MKKIILFILLVAVGVITYIAITQQDVAKDTTEYTSEIFTFTCGDNSLVTIQYDESADFAKLTTRDVSYKLTRDISASGTKYIDSETKTKFSEHQDEATVELPDFEVKLTCQITENTEVVANANSELIQITSPAPGETVANPVQVSGEARGYWFFEASAPVTITNWDGLIIGEGYITADGDWMTEDFVPFTGTIEYTLPADSYSTLGTIIFKRDNPSGLPENDAFYEMPVTLEVTN